MLFHSLKHTPAADFGQKTTRVVLLCDHRNEKSVVPLIECLSWYTVWSFTSLIRSRRKD